MHGRLPSGRPPLLRVFPELLLVPYALIIFLVTLLQIFQAGKVTGLVNLLAVWMDSRMPQAQSYALLEFVANVALPVPLGILMRWDGPGCGGGSSP